MLMCLLLLLCDLAHASGRVELPAGEPAGPWGPPLAAAGLSLTDPSGSPDVSLLDQGGVWQIQLKSGERVAVNAPVTPAERVDLAMLISSLVQPAEALPWESVAPPPALPPPPSRPVSPPRPGPRAPAPPPSSPPVAPPAPSPPEVSPPSLVLPAAPAPLPLAALPPILPALLIPAPAPPSRPPIHLWTELAVRGGARVDATLTPVLQLGAGAELGRWRLGGRAQTAAAAMLVDLGEDRAQRASDLGLGLWVAPTPQLDLGLITSLSWRTWSQEDTQVARAMVPVLGVDLHTALPLTRRLDLTPGLSLERDLRGSTAQVGARDPQPLSPWSFSAGVGVMLNDGDQ